tara:strand:+ start:314 stop:439 length:126 start_codon:yes stop_codon:yes gene_type:complete
MDREAETLYVKLILRLYDSIARQEVEILQLKELLNKDKKTK